MSATAHTTDTPLNAGLDHIALRAYDIDATVRFYTEALGFRFLNEWAAPEAGVNRCVFLDAGDDRIIEIFDAASTPPGGDSRPLDADTGRPGDEERARHAALVHFAVRTEDPATLFDRAVAAGARPLMAPARVDAKGAAPMTLTVAFVYGPDGEVVEFIKRPALRTA
ncbi:Glyoxalase-like domain protein [Streptomyces sp. ADI96-02]|uniref:VOC family protein n=1 Tax=unclassified Streptomyces TaxID=2593676 RepID=UPI000F551D6A|nr:VOC family protein [Streptomyces sp. ADI96-02]RPK69062.1 Glyoxalase-like domain protein [Streptomyces sp. ADI96-02]